MTMPPIGLKKIQNFTEEELKMFLESNNITACSKIFDREAIDGKTFLTLSRSDFSKWKKVVGESEVKEFKTFLKEIKSKPDAFILKGSITNPDTRMRPGTSTLPSKSKYTAQKEQSVQVTIQQINVVQKDVKQNKNGTLTKIKVLPDRAVQPQKPMLPPALPKRLPPIKQPGVKTELPQSKSIFDSKYYLKIDRQEAEIYLKTLTREGAYLFRPSTKHHCAFSVYFEDEIRHFGIQLVRGKLEFESVGNDVRFNSLEEIVQYFNKYPELQTANTKQIIVLSKHVCA